MGEAAQFKCREQPPWPGQHFLPGCRVTQCPELQSTSPVLKRKVAVKPHMQHFGFLQTLQKILQCPLIKIKIQTKQQQRHNSKFPLIPCDSYSVISEFAGRGHRIQLNSKLQSCGDLILKLTEKLQLAPPVKKETDPGFAPSQTHHRAVQS